MLISHNSSRSSETNAKQKHVGNAYHCINNQFPEVGDLIDLRYVEL